VPADAVLRVGVSPERKVVLLAQALDYQSTLTKSGTVRKRRSA
jgi:hypothetical protein